MKCCEITKELEKLSPLHFACPWDNVGLMVGSGDDEINRVLVTLDCDDAAIGRAIKEKADLVVSHHPLIFGGLQKVNDASLTGSRVLRLIRNHIDVYSMHTNFDIKGGMASLAGERIGMKEPRILEKSTETEGLGRWDIFAEDTVGNWAEKVKNSFGLPNVSVFGDMKRRVTKVAIAPGSGKEAVSQAVSLGIELIITGDVGHHTGIDAVACGCSVIDAGHYGIEHIFIEFTGDYLRQVTDCQVITMPKKLPYVVV